MSRKPIERIRAFIERLIAKMEATDHGGQTTPVPDTPADAKPEAIVRPPTWESCTRASCWDGSNAQKRMQNILSPSMPDSKFKEYVAWMKSIGCNTAHPAFSNEKDGEHSGYCIYGSSWSWKIHKPTVELFKARIAYLRKHGFAVVPWLFMDDSRTFNQTAATNFSRYCSDLKAARLLDQASIVVAGLELDEYFKASQVAALIAALRKVWSGMVGTHQTSGKYNYSAIADICFYQTKPGKSAAQIKAETRKVVSAVKKPVCFFELARNPNRTLCDAAFAGGAFAVGNWRGTASELPQDEPPATGTTQDAVDMADAVWIGPSGRKAAIDGTISDISADADTIRYKPSKETDAWRPTSGSKNCNQLSCAFFMRGGKPTGGKFDWSTYSRKSRSLKNIKDGYIKGVKPVKGEPWYFCLMQIEGKRRTPVYKVGPWK